MLQYEFEDRIGKEISCEDYKKVEMVYMYYNEEMTKDEVASLYKIGGMKLIEDMLPRAERNLKIEQLEDKRTVINGKIIELYANINKIYEEITNLREEDTQLEKELDELQK